VFGSNAPLFYFDSALLKVKEAGFNDLQRRAVLEENAQRLLSSPAA
jgi:predicted TIM-barrel fold metal-dependent hydrolase